MCVILHFLKRKIFQETYHCVQSNLTIDPRVNDLTVSNCIEHRSGKLEVLCSSPGLGTDAGLAFSGCLYMEPKPTGIGT